MSQPGPLWPDDIFRVLLEADVRQVGYVPDSGHARLIEMCRVEPSMAAVPLTSEEEGVALLAGAWLGGQRGALLMQSSGVGNCVNMLALTRTCRFPLLMLVTMRGQWGEANPWQLPMGQIAGEVLRLSGVVVHGIEAAEDAGETVAAAARAAFDAQAAAAVLISQRLVGAKTFGN
ncbi:MAG: thiamine pyrophosphate-binding protein [Alphaproteobacteria bacterium]